MRRTAGLTLTRRIALLIAAVLLPALLGSLLIHTLSARDALQTQLAVRNGDAAAALALALTQQKGDRAAIETVAAAQFDLGSYRRITLRPQAAASAAAPWIDLKQSAAVDTPAEAPEWFVQALPLAAPPGTAQVGSGWQALGQLEVQAHAAWAHDALWAAVTRTAGLLALIALAAAAWVAWALRGWQRPLAATVAQAQALEQGRFVTAEEPRLPELRELTRAMNTTVNRLREVFAAQAEQVALLQQQAHADAVTGLPTRRQFMGRLDALLADSGGPGAGLVLVRLHGLAELNHRVGHAQTDGLLKDVAELLEAFIAKVRGSFGGRLNGADFALVLPLAGQVRETAEAISHALAAHPALREVGARVSVAGCDGLPGKAVHDAGTALAAADLALAQAEASMASSSDGAAVAVVDAAEPGSAAVAIALGGERHWRDLIAQALADGRVQMAEYPVLSPNGGLVHLECPLRVQLTPGGAFESATRWLALATRSRLLPQVDTAVVTLALRAISADGRPRAVHVSPVSLREAGFIAAVQALLAAQPQAAQRLWLEWVEAGEPLVPAALREATLAWRLHGVRVGVEHAGASAQALTALHEAGLDYVKVDARHLQGLADDAAVRGYAQSLVALIHGLGWLALGEGLKSERDLAALWPLGFDGATGPAVRLPG